MVFCVAVCASEGTKSLLADDAKSPETPNGIMPESFASFTSPNEESLEIRMRAAHELCQKQELRHWLLLAILTDAGPADWRKEEIRPAQFRSELIKGAYAASLVELINSLPDQPTPDVLWALTSRLDHTAKGTGTLVGDDGTKFQVRTPAVRDIARRKLTEVLGKDLGYEVEKWRSMIHERYRRKP